VSEGAAGARPRAEASFHPVAGGGVLFDAARGRLYALNPVAGMTWLCMRNDMALHERWTFRAPEHVGTGQGL
jgi:hypothetical protein